MIKNFNVPYSSTLEPILTHSCNLNCSYCFEKNKLCKNPTMDLNKLLNMVMDGYHSLPGVKFYLMGGEPTLAIDIIKGLYSYIEGNDELEYSFKDEMLNSIRLGLTTNGTLINKNIEYYKDKNFSFQISLDGPEFVNDKCRVDLNGKGYFSKISNNIKLLKDNNLDFSIHGAISKQNYKYIPEILEFHLKYAIEELGGIDNLIGNDSMLLNCLHRNMFMYVIEDDITDEDIDVFLNEHIRAYEMIMRASILDGLTQRERKLIYLGYLKYQGGPCGAGDSLLTLEASGKAYGCHRIAEVSDVNPIEEWNIEEGFVNQNTYYLFNNPFSKKLMASTWFTTSPKDNKYPRLMWCPGTNIKYTGELNILPPKYATLMAEFSRFVPKLINYYELDE